MISDKLKKIKGKRILITAGPTWVPIDRVRVISNIATGETGILLAKEAAKKGAKVTLVLGPVGEVKIKTGKLIKVIRFRFFDELKKIIIRELKSHDYDAVIHSAAVSDYRPKRLLAHKVASGIKNLKINLVPTQKLIDLIRRLDRDLFLVGFKFEPDTSKARLFREARRLINRSTCGLVVANTIKGGRYSAYLVRSNKVQGPLNTKEKLAEQLINNL